MLVLMVAVYISIHTFLAEGDADPQAEAHGSIISIHTFLAEGDGLRLASFRELLPISIHTFLAEGDCSTIF